MKLDEQDKSDLLGLVSGFGTADSLERAERLVSTNPEAGEYLRQSRVIAAAFEPPPAAQPDERLSPEDADRVANLVWARVENRGSQARQRVLRVPFWRTPATGAAAAAILLAFCGTWVAWMTSGSAGHRTPLGELVIVPRSAAGAMPYDQGDLVPGQVVTTTSNRFARITMPNGTALTLESLGTMQVGQDGRSFALREGSLRIAVKDTATVSVEDLTITLRSGVSWIGFSQSGFVCTVYKGSATISTPKESYEMTARQSAYSNKEMQTLKIRSLTTPMPGWVGELLESQPGRR